MSPKRKHIRNDGNATEWRPQDAAAADDDSESSPELYCECRSAVVEEDEDVKWIACDAKGCPIEWFHLDCVGLTDKTVPEGNWYCSQCRSGATTGKANVVDNQGQDSDSQVEMDDLEDPDTAIPDYQSTTSSQQLALYVCEICEKQFSSKDNLLKHKQQHLNLFNQSKASPPQGKDVEIFPPASTSQSNPALNWELKSTTSEERATDTMSPQDDDDMDNQSLVSLDRMSKQASIDNLDDNSPTDEDNNMVNLTEEKLKILSQYTDEQIIAEMAARKEAFVCCCGIVFEDQSLYFLHKGCHNTNNPKKCSFCGFEANDWYDFTSHFFVHKNNK